MIPAQQAIARLSKLANLADSNPGWPEESWLALRDVGALRWCIPPQYGGEGLEGVEILSGYEALADRKSVV